MKIGWLLADKLMYFYLPATESVLQINGNMNMQTLWEVKICYINKNILFISLATI